MVTDLACGAGGPRSRPASGNEDNNFFHPYYTGKYLFLFHKLCFALLNAIISFHALK